MTECCLDSKPQPASQLVGKPIADFHLPRVSDNLPETLYGAKGQKVTVLFITSVGCPCSAKYEGRMAELARFYGHHGVRFVAMNSSYGETPKLIAEHAQSAGFSFPVLKDAGNVIADRIEARVNLDGHSKWGKWSQLWFQRPTDGVWDGAFDPRQ